MARRRWGDRVSDNELVDIILAGCFYWGITAFVISGVAVAVFFGILYVGALMGQPTTANVEVFLNTLVMSRLFHSALELYMALSAIAVVVGVAIVSTIVILNEADKIVIHRRL